jgi:hypothetical protein
VSAGLASVLAAGAICGLAGCANDAAPVELSDRLLANERLAYAARSRDLDEAERAVGEARMRLVDRCEQWAAARVALLEARIDRSALELRDEFEARAWSLLWEAYPRVAESRTGDVHERLAAATRAAAAAAREAERHPNDARLARRVAEARAEEAGLALLGQETYLQGAASLADRIEAARRRLRDRIDAAFAPLRADVRALEEASCALEVPDTAGPVSDRRAAYAALHGAQIEGLTALRARLDQPSVARLVASGVAEALRERLTLVLPPAVVDPLLAEGMRRVDEGIGRAERDLRDGLHRELEALRDGLERPS